MPPSKPTPSPPPPPPRNSPYLPTPTEQLFTLLFPLILIFGTVFSILSPETRAAAYDHVTQSHLQDPSVAPSYFARKSNLFNVVFVKRGWGWNSAAFFAFLLTHPATTLRTRATLRWAAVTIWWILITQWCFGPPIIDRGFRWTGGRCEIAAQEVRAGQADLGEAFTAVACKAAGGKWSGGHDISGHVFLLVLGTGMLMQEMGWAVGRWKDRRVEERCVVLDDGAVKSANVVAEAAGDSAGVYDLGPGSKAAIAIAGLNLWMLLMTAIYFHTWFEKVSFAWCCYFCLWLTCVVDGLGDGAGGLVRGVCGAAVRAGAEKHNWHAWCSIDSI